MSQIGPIDVQTHYIPPAVVEALERRQQWPRIAKRGEERLIVYGEDTAYPLIREMVDLDTKIEAMDKAGIAMSVLSVNIPGLDYFDENEVEAIARDANDQLAAEIGRRPDRFAALATLPLKRPDAAAAELERAMGLGLCGAMVYSNVAGRSLHEPEFRPVFDAAAQQDAAILIHPTFPRSAESVKYHELVSVFGYMFDTATAALDLVLDGLYNRHPDFKLILPHAGSVVPYLVGRLDYEGAMCHGEGFGELDASLERVPQAALRRRGHRLRAGVVVRDRLPRGRPRPLRDGPSVLGSGVDERHARQGGPDRRAAPRNRARERDQDPRHRRMT